MDSSSVEMGPALPPHHDSYQDSRHSDESDNDSETSSSQSIADYFAIIRSIEIEAEQDLRTPLAMRAHLEKSVEAYWQKVVELHESRHSLNEQTIQRRTLHLNKHREAILEHPFLSVSPYSMRWPMPMHTVSPPQWSLADEVAALMERQGRKNGLNVDDAHRLSLSLGLPAMAQTHATLVQLLQALHERYPASGTDARRRCKVVTWRTVLDAISTVTISGGTAPAAVKIPTQVVEASRARLYSMYGNAQPRPPETLVASLGMGGSEGLAQSVLRGHDAGSSSGMTRSASAVESAPTRHPISKHRLRHNLDTQLLAAGRTQRSAWKLQNPPTKRRV